MKRCLFILLPLFLLISLPAYPQADSASRLKERISAASASVRTMKCDFEQTKHLSLLRDSIVSRGTMYYAAPDRFRWEYTSPSSYLFIVNGSRIYAGNTRRKDTLSTDANRMLKGIVSAVMGTVTGTAVGGGKDFSVSLSDHGRVVKAVLVPLRKEMKRMFAKVVLTFNSPSFTVSRIDIYEKNGDLTEIRLSDISTNTTVDDALFAVP